MFNDETKPKVLTPEEQMEMVRKLIATVIHPPFKDDYSASCWECEQAKKITDTILNLKNSNGNRLLYVAHPDQTLPKPLYQYTALDPYEYE